MTIVATWVNLERINEPSIWTVADTKISDLSNPEATLTLEGSKVLELPIICKMTGGSNYGRPYYKASLGFAYAGSSLIGLNTVATLTALFCNLGGSPGRLPDHINIVNKAFEVAKVYSDSIGSDVEISIWGFCPKSELPFIGAISICRKLNNPFNLQITHGSFEDLNCILLGSRKTEILKEINDRALSLTKMAQHAYWRVPVKVLRDIVKDQRYPEIGGNLQIGTVSNVGSFEYAAVSSEIKGITPTMHTSMFRNIDLFNEFGLNVGDCSINIPTLEIDFPGC